VSSWLRDVVARAASISERLGPDFIPAEADEERLRTRRRAWCEAAAGSDAEAFARRLAWDELDDSSVRRALGPVELAPDAPLPPWATTLAALLDDAECGAATEARPNRFLAPDQSQPFQEVLAPLVRAASHRLAAQAGAKWTDLGDNAQAGLERALLGRLCAHCARSLDLELSVLRRRRGGLFWAAPSGSDSSDVLYREFVAGMCGDRLRRFFAEYAALARIVAVSVDHWTAMATELAGRLAADAGALEYAFHGGAPYGSVAALEADLSDPHNGGRTVVFVTFTSGLRLVYKPKHVGMEAAWSRLLHWLNERGATPVLKPLRILERDGYGWAEFVAPRSCARAEERRRYYERSGMLLALIYALGGSDCHDENIIPAGEHPVLVDAETVIVPAAAPFASTDADAEESAAFAYSVLSTSMLPAWILRDDQSVSTIGGLTAVPERAGRKVPLWRGPAAAPDEITAAPWADFTEQIEGGFRRMYDLLLSCRDALLAPGGPMAAFAGQRVRFLHRNTQIYGMLHRRTLRPEFLRDGTDRDIQLDALSRALLFGDEKPLYWPILAAERRAMERMDIPLFTVEASRNRLPLETAHVLEGCFHEPCFDRAVRRLGSLDAHDRDCQIRLLRAALAARPVTARNRVDEASPPIPLDGLQIAPDALIAAALAQAEALRRQAIGDPRRRATWFSFDESPDNGLHELRPVGPSLYSGTGGIVLFLAALERATGGAGFRDLALAALNGDLQALRQLDGRVSQVKIGIGGGAGIGSFVYALCRIAALLDEEALLVDARRAASLVTPARIAADRQFDVLGGAAGAILGLLTLYEATRDTVALERAAACGRHLLARRVPSVAGFRAWPTAGDRLLTGFSHGAAGIAYALLRLAAATGEYAFRDAAEEAVIYERSVYLPEKGNWPDLRDGAEKAREAPTAMGWCHGAPGIGLARVGGLCHLDTPDVRRDIDAALAATERSGLHAEDHLCCGSLGRADFLLEAGLRLQRPDSVACAQAIGAAVAFRATERGCYALGAVDGSCVPGLFKGISGVGFQLLRLGCPERVPSVLLWQ
jgi:lantibiotic modifying enzyme